MGTCKGHDIGVHSDEDLFQLFFQLVQLRCSVIMYLYTPSNLDVYHLSINDALIRLTT